MFIIVANYESQMCMFVRIELTAMVRFTDRHETIPISRPTNRPKNNTEALRRRSESPVLSSECALNEID